MANRRLNQATLVLPQDGAGRGGVGLGMGGLAWIGSELGCGVTSITDANAGIAILWEKKRAQKVARRWRGEARPGQAGLGGEESERGEWESVTRQDIAPGCVSASAASAHHHQPPRRAKSIESKRSMGIYIFKKMLLGNGIRNALVIRMLYVPLSQLLTNKSHATTPTLIHMGPNGGVF